MTQDELNRAELWSRLPGEIAARIDVDAVTGCWLWTGSLDRPNSSGYGVMVRNKKRLRMHRFVYELLIGPIPPPLVPDHLCRVRRCVCPLHIEPVTTRENILRGETVAARNKAKTHCQNGHEFNARNTRIRTDGNRDCRACQRASPLRNRRRNEESCQRMQATWTAVKVPHERRHIADRTASLVCGHCPETVCVDRKRGGVLRAEHQMRVHFAATH